MRLRHFQRTLVMVSGPHKSLLSVQIAEWYMHEDLSNKRQLNCPQAELLAGSWHCLAAWP